MKKFIIALLCFCLLIPFCILPVSAADSTEYVLYGVYHFNDSLVFTGVGISCYVTLSGSYLPFNSNGDTFPHFWVSVFTEQVACGLSSSSRTMVYDKGWLVDSYKSITFPVPTSVPESVYLFFTNNSTRNYPRECDGTLHVITDTDYDGVCELCDTLIRDDLRPSPPEAPVFDVNINASYVYDYGAEASPLSVSASVSDGGTLSYQWYKNSTNSITGGVAIGGATVSAYQPLTTTAGTVYYYCKVTNTIGGVYTEAFSNVAPVTVRSPVADQPVFDQDLPSSSFVYDLGAAADQLTVSASVSDGGTLSYQWCKSSSMDVTAGTAISGATGPSFTPPTSEAGTYYYFCRVVNAIHGVSSVAYSNVVMVKVLAPDPPEAPVFSLDLNPNYSYTVGDQAVSLKVSASVSDGGSLFYQWFMSSTNSISSGTPISGANSVSYVPSTSAAGTTYYYCMVTNTLNGLTTEAFSSVAAVTVSEPVPVFCDGSSHSPYDPDLDYTCNTCGNSILESLRVGYYDYRGHWLLAFPYFDYDDGSTYDYAYLGNQNGVYFMALFYDPLYVDSAKNTVHYGGDGGFVMYHYDAENVEWVFAGTYASGTGDQALDNAYLVLWSKYDLLSSSGSVWIAGDPNFVVVEPEVPEDPGWTENESNTLWGWFTSIFDGLENIWSAITNLPGTIAELILAGLKEIFVPDMEEMKEQVALFYDRLNFSPLADSSGSGGRWESTVNGGLGDIGMIEGQAPDNTVGDVYLGNDVMGHLDFYDVTFMDLTWAKEGVEYFRPVINGFLTLLIALFWFRQLMEFIGQVPVSAGPDNRSFDPSGPITSHQHIDPGKGLRKL